MAAVDNGVDVTVNALYIPDGYTLPTVTPFATTGKPAYDIVLSVDRATVQNADKAVTFGNILTDAVIGLSKQAKDLVENDFENTNNTVTFFIDFYNIESNVPRGKTNDFYTDADDVYLCSCKIYVQVT